ncbi:hypothetical protein DIPPA_00217 [Diplonema papillatum]|nr:hypothetical protein DIPPA_00217 [Diplonema papillatum]
MFSWNLSIVVTVTALAACGFLFWLVVGIVHQGEEGSRECNVILPHEVFIDKRAGEPLGVMWEDQTMVRCVDNRSAADASGAVRFVGRRVLRVNGKKVASWRDIRAISQPACIVRLQFDPQSPVVAVKVVHAGILDVKKWSDYVASHTKLGRRGKVQVLGVMEPEVTSTLDAQDAWNDTSLDRSYLILMRLTTFSPRELEEFFHRCRNQKVCLFPPPLSYTQQQRVCHYQYARVGTGQTGSARVKLYVRYAGVVCWRGMLACTS